ncbi:hypothetical protein ACFL12_04000 [Pseudomonadota bacterium]
MRVYRQLIWLCAAVLVAGCLPFDPTPSVFNRSPFARTTQAEGNAHCAGLFATNNYAPLAGQMPIAPGELPTAQMMEITLAPNAGQVTAIQTLENAARECRARREAAGIPTSATEDILAHRTSQLRYGLYKGEIPFAVYNYGLAKALRQHNAFLIEGERAAQQGREAGQTIQMLGQFGTLAALLGVFDQGAEQQTQWTCASGPVPNDSVDCY